MNQRAGADLPPVLFHGTPKDFERPRPGGDQVFWTADNSAVAQTYIPATGSTITASLTHGLQDKLWPQVYDAFTAVAAQMGYEAQDVRLDDLGRIRSYRYPPQGWPTYDEVCDHMEQQLGYPRGPRGKGCYELLVNGWDAEKQQPVVMPHDYRRMGHLLIIGGHEQLRLYDMSTGESDLMAPQHRRLGLFAKLREQGWDGVVIDDFAQCRNWGNVQHKSYGFFEEALGALQIQRIPATRFDWADDHARSLQVTKTPEYVQWERAQTARQVLCNLTAPAHPSPV